MDGIKIYYKDIENIRINKTRQLIITFKRTEGAKKAHKHLIKQSPEDHI